MEFSKEFLELKVIHHNNTVAGMLGQGYNKTKKIKLSEDLIVLQVNGIEPPIISTVNQIEFENPSQSIEIKIPTYTKWISKVEELLKYLLENYDTLPNYILYLDGSDTLILNDIMNPKEMLDFYGCKMLFNCEPNLMHTGFNFPSAEYYNPLFGRWKAMYKQQNLLKYGIEHERSINAGVMLAEKEYLKQKLTLALSYMRDDPEKEFPFGCMDDQHLFRFLHIQDFENISIDVYNKYFLFAYPKTYEADETDNEHFEFYKKNYQKLYKNG